MRTAAAFSLPMEMREANSAKSGTPVYCMKNFVLYKPVVFYKRTS